MILKRKKNKKKFVIYTAITWDKDTLLDPLVKVPNCDFICFTTRSDIKSKVWKIVKVPSYYANLRKDAKVYKLMPHFFLQNYEYSLWIDGRVLVKSTSIINFVHDSLQNANIALLIHPERKSTFEEAEKCIEWKLDDPTRISDQVEAYKKDGFNDQISLVAGSVIARKHMERDIIEFDEAWWHENVIHTLRDQLSFPYLAWKYNLKFNILYENWIENEYYKILTYEQRDLLKKS